ncbi:hypothetical protein CTA1_11468 [Colletotrichum tanaceti]|uniref:Uncharacterized protein n=1 Tax=Colletotrichum tanaceti TaxID=1306861 RepID=A0A4U6XRZ6_9PEZI|nr:hypothetical protein CTA1_11468 [Colletotrichum tanaceti]
MPKSRVDQEEEGRGKATTQQWISETRGLQEGWLQEGCKESCSGANIDESDQASKQQAWLSVDSPTSGVTGPGSPALDL